MTINNAADKQEKIKRLIHELKQDTQNIELWLELVSQYDDPQKRRQILNGVLLIDPANADAWTYMAELDGVKKSPEMDMPVDDKASAALDQRNGEQFLPDDVDETETAREMVQSPEKKVRRRRKPPTGSKKCPYCKRTIRASDIECKYCGKKIKKDKGLQKTMEKRRGGVPVGCLLLTVICVIIALIVIIWVVVPFLPF